MGFFDHLQSKTVKTTIQPQRSQIRKIETKTIKASISRSPSVPAQLSSASKQEQLKQRGQSSVRRSLSTSINGTAHSCIQENGQLRRSKSETPMRKRPSPIQRLSSDDDDSGSDDVSFTLRIPKRVKVSESAEPDLERRIWLADAFSDEGDKPFDMIHAADITRSGKKPAEFNPAFGLDGEPATVTLQYPGSSQQERYRLVVPRDKDGFKPVDDIVHVVDTVSENYIPGAYLPLFDDESTGIKRRFRRAFAHASLSEFQSAVEDYNDAIKRLRADNSIYKHIEGKHSLSLPFVERILTQVYARTVSPRVDSLRQYENGTDNVYGELLPRFISDIFKQTKLKSNQIFVDLGSGVGNVVLQAALEVGCESWGCEIMQNACDLAELQHTEFKARCRLWGLAPGDVHLVRGDFLNEETIARTLRKADVVLINNQAFTPQLNNELINHFLDLKEGCQIVSLKSFVPAGHKIQSRNLNSPINLLSVKKLNYWSDSVSWTNAGGTYFIATKDSSRLKAFVEENL
ncbi:hypothetical protein VTO42DRAFT_3614 [Malbranchea cinnamomea]